MILELGIQFPKITTPAPDAHHQIRVFFRMGLGIQQTIPVDGVQLQLMAAGENEELYQLRNFFLALAVAEDIIVQLHGQGAAVNGFP